MGRPGGFRSPADRETYVAAYGDTVARAGVRFEQVGLISRHGRTHVMRAGPSDGPPVVFLHPRALSSTVWIPTVRPFTETHHVHLVDVVGDMNMSVAAVGLRSTNDVDEWMATVLDRLGLDRTSLVGFSYGAWLATTFALARPQRVERLGLLSPVGVFATPRPGWMARALWVHLLHPRTRKAESFVHTMASPATLEHLDELPIGPVITQYAIGVPRFRPSIRDAAPRTYRTDALAALSMPVTVLVGEDDAVVDSPRVASLARQRLPHARVRVVADANHLVTADRPDVVLEELERLLAAPG